AATTVMPMDTATNIRMAWRKMPAMVSSLVALYTTAITSTSGKSSAKNGQGRERAPKFSSRAGVTVAIGAMRTSVPFRQEGTGPDSAGGGPAVSGEAPAASGGDGAGGDGAVGGIAVTAPAAAPAAASSART